MPKDKSSRTSVSQKERSHPYKLQSGLGKGHEVIDVDASADRKDWEDATCPICMDFPHNAILLLCTSHDKGCRPYMCDTSHRHSNCLDQYRKAQLGLQKTCGSREPALENPPVEAIDVSIVTVPDSLNVSTLRSSRRLRRNLTVSASSAVEGSVGAQILDHEPVIVDVDEHMEEPAVVEQPRSSSPVVKGDVKGLACPLCRGKVTGWRVIEAAREQLNQKARSCAQESCSFAGTYEELRAHARSEHPLARPSEIDPARQRDWRRLERQRDLGDVLSTIRSAMPGATVLGDYVIEDGLDNDSGDIDLPGGDGHWWTVFLLFQVFGPATIAGGRVITPRVRSQPRGHRRAGAARNVLWGENLLRNGNVDPGSSSASSDGDEWTPGTSRRRQRSQRRSES